MKRLTKILIVSAIIFSFSLPFITVSSTPQQAVEIVISTGVQTTDALTDMVEEFNGLGKGFTVKLEESTWETQNQHDTYVTKLAAKDKSIDIISMDVIWPPEFTEAGWLEPVDDLFEGTGYTKDEYLEAPILAGTYEGHQYGVPWFHDSAMLFYRADIIKYAADNDIITANRAPNTWAELRDWTRLMLADDDLVDYFKGSDGILHGFVWQAREYEGMICDFMEYLGGTGQTSFLLETNGDLEPGFNTSEARETLEFMKSLFDEVNITDSHADGRMVRTSPEVVLTMHEETSRAVWNAGNSIFHRNWPYCYRLSMDDAFLNGSEGSYLGTADKVFGVKPMPPKSTSITGARTSCLGGWQLGLNVYSENKDEAKEFIKWLTDYDQQKYYLLEGGQIPTRIDVYDDTEILASDQAYVHELFTVFENALPRPVHPDYPAMSKAIWAPMHTYLSGGYTLNEGTEKMNAAVEDILTGGAKPSGITDWALLALFGAGTLVLIRRKRK
jgi:multiple sugar transport system substrate-binding protein